MKPKHQEILTILAASDHPLTLIDIKNAMEPAQAGKYKGTSEIAGVLSYLQRPLGYVASNKTPSYDNGKATFEWSITDAGKAALSAAFKTHLPHTSETEPQPVDPEPSAETALIDSTAADQYAIDILAVFDEAFANIRASLKMFIDANQRPAIQNLDSKITELSTLANLLNDDKRIVIESIIADLEGA